MSARRTLDSQRRGEDSRCFQCIAAAVMDGDGSPTLALCATPGTHPRRHATMTKAVAPSAEPQLGHAPHQGRPPAYADKLAPMPAPGGCLAARRELQSRHVWPEHHQAQRQQGGQDQPDRPPCHVQNGRRSKRGRANSTSKGDLLPGASRFFVGLGHSAGVRLDQNCLRARRRQHKQPQLPTIGQLLVAYLNSGRLFSESLVAPGSIIRLSFT